MRKVEFCKGGYYGGKAEYNSEPSDFETGYFHCFTTEGNTEEGLECWGIIEREDGIIERITPGRIKFLSPPKSEENIESVDSAQQLKSAKSLFERIIHCWDNGADMGLVEMDVHDWLDSADI